MNPAPPLGRITIRNLGIVYVVGSVARVLGIIGLLILARLLVPHDFGVVALSGLIISVLSLFKDFGLSAALIQIEDDLQAVADTAFWSTLLMRLALYVFLVLSAPIVALFFEEPMLVWIIPVAGLGLVIEGFAAVHATFLAKKLDFGRLSLIEALNIVVGSTISIGLALIGFSFWSLVLGSLAIMPLSVWLYWRFEPWRPSLKFDRTKLRALIDYGKHIVFINSSGFATKNLDSAVAGKILGATSLGIYQLAARFGLFSMTTLGAPLSRVLFPTYARIQGEAERVKQAYLRTIFPIAAIAFPACTILLTLPDLVVSILLGPGWEGAIDPLRVLSLYGLAASLSSPSWNVFLALGRPEYASQSVMIQLGLMAALVVPGAVYGGLAGLAIAVTIAVVIGSVFQMARASRLLGIQARELGSLIAPCGLGAALMGSLLVLARPISGSSALGFLVLVLIGIVSFILAVQLASSGRLLRQVTEILQAFKKLPA